jgi:hypothetical protein
MLSNPTMMAMGGGGDFAFQIDGSFKGTTGESETFGNRSLLHSGKRDFQVFDIEVSIFFFDMVFFVQIFFSFFHDYMYLFMTTFMTTFMTPFVVAVFKKRNK